MYRKNYWACISEKRIYHTLPSFDTVNEKALMRSFGITNQEKWIEITLEEAQKYARGWKSHYVFSAYTTAEWEIIDCPELTAYQKAQNLEGIYIPTMNNKPALEEEEVIDEIIGFEL